MRRVRRHDQDLAGRGLDLLIAYGEQAGDLADDENLGIGMDVQARAAADIGQ